MCNKNRTFSAMASQARKSASRCAKVACSAAGTSDAAALQRSKTCPTGREYHFSILLTPAITESYNAQSWSAASLLIIPACMA